MFVEDKFHFGRAEVVHLGRYQSRNVFHGVRDVAVPTQDRDT